MKPASRSTTRSLLALVGFAVSSAANATAIFAGSAEATLTITSVTNLTTPGDLTGLVIKGTALVSSTNELPQGSAGTSVDGDAEVVGVTPSDLSVGDGLFQRSAVAGFADPVGLSIAEHLTDGIINLKSSSATDTFEVAFLLAYSLTTSASADNPVVEFALAEAFLEVFRDNGPDVASLMLFANSDTDSSPDSIVDEIAFAITLGPEDSDVITVHVDADGAAEGETIPEPHTSILLLLGLVLIAAARTLDA